MCICWKSSWRCWVDVVQGCRLRHAGGCGCARTVLELVSCCSIAGAAHNVCWHRCSIAVREGPKAVNGLQHVWSNVDVCGCEAQCWVMRLQCAFPGAALTIRKVGCSWSSRQWAQRLLCRHLYCPSIVWSGEQPCVLLGWCLLVAVCCVTRLMGCVGICLCP